MEWELKLTIETILFIIVLVGILFNPLSFKVMGGLLGKIVKTKSIPYWEYILFMIHILLFTSILLTTPSISQVIQDTDTEEDSRSIEEMEEDLEDIEETLEKIKDKEETGDITGREGDMVGAEMVGGEE